jgi:7-cyano-7-deazaguanine synthase in queuosine biosynthesis
MLVNKTIFNNVNLYYDSSWKNVGYMVSGGLDSAIGLFLLAKEFKESNLEIAINPITYVLDTEYKPSQEDHVKNIINKVIELTKYHFIHDSNFIFLSNEDSKPTRKNNKMQDVNSNFIIQKNLSALYVSDTLNPPEEIRKDWKDDHKRSIWRDNALPSVEIHQNIAFVKPLVNLNKQHIVNLYKDLNLLDSLAVLTISCDETIDGMTFYKLPFPCGECWWCRERRWGFESNGLDYEKYSK